MSTARERPEEISKRIKREGDATDQLGRRHLHLNTATPCAACKLLRRRCAQECPFSPYFSPHEPHKFASVHKVFGASNVSKMLMEVPENQRADAANSLVYEANIRIRDPIYGCMGAISALQHQVRILESELNVVRAEILKHKYRQSTPSVLHATEVTLITSAEVPVAPATQMVPLVPAPPALSTSSSSIYSAAPNSISTAYSSVSNGNVAYFG